jgi:hypothetical protein
MKTKPATFGNVKFSPKIHTFVLHRATNNTKKSFQYQGNIQKKFKKINENQFGV